MNSASAVIQENKNIYKELRILLIFAERAVNLVKAFICSAKG